MSANQRVIATSTSRTPSTITRSLARRRRAEHAYTIHPRTQPSHPLIVRCDGSFLLVEIDDRLDTQPTTTLAAMLVADTPITLILTPEGAQSSDAGPSAPRPSPRGSHRRVDARPRRRRRSAHRTHPAPGR
jgi:hypothetical protein